MPAVSDAAPAWTVGEITVRRIDETALPAPTGRWLLPDATPDVVAQAPWLQQDFTDHDGTLRLATHSFAIETQGLRLLVDTGIGNGKARTNPAWDHLDSDYLPRLTAAGFAPDAVDLVLLTHLHTDHVGWNTRADRGDWVPTFPRARYLTARTEWDHWSGQDLDDARRQMFRDSVHPVRDAGLLDLVEVPGEGATVAPGVRLLPTPGHTPGQFAVELRSAGRTALITGDCIHHPVQLPRPDICSCADVDPAQAARTRRSLLASLAGTDTLLLGSHFPPPTAGRVIAEGDAYRLSPVAPDRL
ncbi:MULTISPECIES: MBL fold metallo-hydrolase [unclassified Streptomyces]|uniref:MBL fold metallo-hydrolase n=1 Tax=unclassified Streptomyces TaxID=2593676 RepID=UPI00088B0302|nr:MULTISPECIES: MBL fold metallo-hydrolase [unclassified Streptomyces]PBC83903.1 glyoxylase-like metal-dependent hydrolase (beta-lactamase superfamily II) [Streptomyces sp. 2321.6]SDR37342.1 Glyoxylase, beta-lactamase superfamily II [Streptomyces sp. KS_16]SED12960.1 Glyoxylase, beta-lactamase superfamily II [Streptomyces sp. 2133.1]SEE66065.1 Glyoxylase, beta-lactamase superfamily II [Streptomyces sp. 2112.3]SNC69981.1 Glyoxylase, beta-lactamase superfamily II [Streptomyces sp. 2114.4]